MDYGAEGQSVLPGRRHVGHTDPRVPGGWANIKNILWENIKTWSANIKTYCGQSFQILNMLLLEFDLAIINEDGFLDKRTSSFHLEEDNVD